jgi:thioredoxin reductase (NADPH)
MNRYDCAIVGGGLAGLQAAIQLGRYQHRVVVLDAEDGRSNLCRCYHNILGWPEGVSGERLRELGRRQAESTGIEFEKARIARVEEDESGFELAADEGRRYYAKRLLLATGVQDRIPIQEQLISCLGESVFICPDCDGYETRNKRTLVFGSGNPGADMALKLRYWTSDLIYINHEGKQIDSDKRSRLAREGIVCIEQPIAAVSETGGRLQGVTLENGDFIEGGHAFVAFGGNKVRSDLAVQLGIALTENNHIRVDPRTKMTSRENVWAAGDVTVHSEQAVIAMGDGLQAAIWIHKSLLQDRA